MTSGLLPEGLRDRLPPQADAAASLLRAVIDSVAAHGYERVSPPLVEFEDELVGRLKSARSRDLLRFVDPISQRTVVLRPDITSQIGRIATTRLADEARPLRLCYGGSVLKLRATQLRPERELIQTGAELIGADSVAAAVEVISVAIEALRAVGATGITLDLTLPDLVDTLATSVWPLAPNRLDAIRSALDAKDAGALTAEDAKPYFQLIAAAAPLETSLAQLRSLHLGDILEMRLMAVEAIAAAFSHSVRITLDPTERHGFEYQSWLGFSLFCDGISGEAGRGGTYTVVHPDANEEPAIGFSLYLDPLVDAGFMVSAPKRLFIPLGTPEGVSADYRAKGWSTVAALGIECDAADLRCSHALDGARIVEISFEELER